MLLRGEPWPGQTQLRSGSIDAVSGYPDGSQILRNGHSACLGGRQRHC